MRGEDRDQRDGNFFFFNVSFSETWLTACILVFQCLVYFQVSVSAVVAGTQSEEMEYDLGLASE